MWPRPYRARYFYNAKISDENLNAMRCDFMQFCLGEVPSTLRILLLKNGPYETKESFAVAKNIVLDQKWTVIKAIIAKLLKNIVDNLQLSKAFFGVDDVLLKTAILLLPIYRCKVRSFTIF